MEWVAALPWNQWQVWSGIRRICLISAITLTICACATDRLGNTPLINAAKDGDTETVSLLLRNGSDPNEFNKKGGDAITAAARHGYNEIVSILLKNGATINPKSGEYTPLMAASSGGHIETVKYLLTQGANINAEGPDGWTALMSASSRGNYEVAKLLISHGANVNANSKIGPPISQAAVKGHRELVSLLIASNADVNLATPGKTGWTPLMKAAHKGNLEIIEELVNAGADINATTSKGETALMVADQAGHDDVVEKLLKNGENKLTTSTNTGPSRTERAEMYQAKHSSENELLNAAVVLKSWSKLEKGMSARDVFKLLGPNSIAAMIYGNSSPDTEKTYTQEFYDGRGGNKYMSIKLVFEQGVGLSTWEMWQSQAFKDTLRKNGNSKFIQ